MDEKENELEEPMDAFDVAVCDFISEYRKRGYKESALRVYVILAGCEETLAHFSDDYVKSYEHFTMLLRTCESEEEFTKKALEFV